MSDKKKQNEPGHDEVFIVYLQRARTIVREWPQWKRSLLGRQLRGPDDLENETKKENREAIDSSGRLDPRP